MNHSFNIEIAKKYGIEKAVLLENFYFWIKKNKANKRNMHEGKVYTYNTAEAFAELFPYIKERKIAQILREMENEDGLLISGQFHNYDRTKSYTLTDFAMSFFEPSNIQKFDNGKSESCTMENQKNVSCLNTDINTDINSNINNQMLCKKHETKKENPDYKKVIEQYFNNYKNLFEQKRVNTEKPYFTQRSGKAIKDILMRLSLDNVITILNNAMADNWIVENGYAITTILAESQINKLLNGKNTTSQNKGFNKESLKDKDFFNM